MRSLPYKRELRLEQHAYSQGHVKQPIDATGDSVDRRREAVHELTRRVIEHSALKEFSEEAPKRKPEMSGERIRQTRPMENVGKPVNHETTDDLWEQTTGMKEGKI